LQLTPQEFVLLEYLCRNTGRVVTRSMILDQVWGMRIQPDTMWWMFISIDCAARWMGRGSSR